MAQKNKVKELVGRGLNSYHTKALQQIHRIEKKNKEQNHKISILSNELDNDYLTKTEEGSVISLEHSKEGMIYLDELQGNTLVNYCVDGAKEFTLNDDINEFGTAVKLTETVDDGQVDVLAEGNTMVNVCDQQEPVAITKSYTVESGNHVALQGEFDGKARPVVQGNTLVNLVEFSKKDNSGTPPYVKLNQVQTLKTNTTYTIITPLFDNSKMLMYVGYNGSNSLVAYQTNNIVSFTTGNTIPYNTIYVYYNKRSDSEGTPSVDFINNIDGTGYILLEGDYTNKPIPDYFTGMKSSFEDKVVTQEMVDNGEELAENLGKYRVDYKVTGKNKFDMSTAKVRHSWQCSYEFLPNGGIKLKPTVASGSAFVRLGNVLLKKGIKYTYKSNPSGNYYATYIWRGDDINKYESINFNDLYFNEDTLVNLGLYVSTTSLDNEAIFYPQLEEGTQATAYEPYKEHIKTYYLNSPLLEGDTIEEINGNVVHVHRYYQEIFDGSDDEDWVLHSINDNGIANFRIYGKFNNINGHGVSNTMPIQTEVIANTSTEGFMLPGNPYTPSSTIYIRKYSTSTGDVNSFKTWLQSNPLKIAHELASPQYELISQNDTILTDSYVAGHLDFDTAVPVEQVKFMNVFFNTRYIYPSTDYIIQFEADNVGKITLSLGGTGTIANNQLVNKGVNKFTITTGNTLTSTGLYTEGIGFSASNIVVTEATDKDFGYFKGMKSVGELEENKIEILSKNKNLFKNASLSTKTSWETFNGTIVEGINNNKGIYSEHIQTSHGYYDFLQQSIFLKDNINNAIKNDTWYTFSFYTKGTGKVRTHIYPKAIDTSIKGFVNGVEKNLQPDGNCDWELTNEWVRHSYTFKTKSNINDMGTYTKALFRLMPSDTDILNTVTISCPMLEEGKVATNFVNDLSNKKEILMNEPLRGDYRLRDRVVKINGKFYIERNTIEYSSNELIDRLRFEGVYPNGRTARLGCDAFLTGGRRQFNICDKYKTKQVWDGDEEGIWADHNLKISLSVEKGNDADSLKEYLRNNPFKIVLEREKPTYEPLEVEPVLNTYNDVTHISNNSIIPCNMKIQNTGYNAIIKPNTLYTVALDTNKNGTVGMNLGGAKGTTTNNVATITTPATLSDDSLRLFGKGIKGSKVRLLEGDKTNWIPSFFEGMKSSFEDKLQEDGSYKMEILMNNENLLDLSQHSIGTPYTRQYKIENNTITGTYVGDNYTDFQLWFKLKRNKAYKLSWDAESSYILNGNNSQILKGKLNGYNGDNVLHSSYDTNRGIISNVPCDGWYTLHFHSMKNNQFIKNLQLKEVAYSTDFVERKYNKIQFSSIEPLRKWDRFVFKDSKLMIERGSMVLDLSSIIWGGYEDKDKCYKFGIQMDSAKRSTGNNANLVCNTLPVRADETKFSTICIYSHDNSMELRISIKKHELSSFNREGLMEWLSKNPTEIVYELAEPTYEEIPFELQKIILKGYENGTLFIDTNIPPTSKTTYAGETPIVKSVKLNKTEVLNNTNDINDNIIPYLMDMDYRVVCLQLATEEIEGGVSMARLFGGTYEMIKRDILSKRLTREEYGYRLADYFNAGKLTEEQVRELEELR